MRVYYDLEGLPSFKNAVITTGSFDGVHAGHQKILSQIRHLTNQFQGESVVITFDPHPRQVIYPKDNTLRLLTSTKEKLKYLEQYGVDNAIVLPFTIEFSQQPAREYIEKFLIGKFDPACLVVGYDHRFGLNREGNFELLKEYADRSCFDLVKIEKQDIEEITVSSTKIRQAISDGQIDNANMLLGHPYILSGEVIHGEKIGTSIGFPTANILIDNPIKLLPPEGIYAVHTISEYGVHKGMLYIGTRPTVQQKDPAKRIEVNLFDFNEDLYDKRIELELVAFVREDKELSDLTELKKAIAADKEAVLDILGRRVSEQLSNNTAGVVALNYNGRTILPDYLPSVVKHTPQYDIVLADNASTDASVEYVQQHFPRVKITRMIQNTGYAGGYNIALSQLEYEYFALINTDIEVTDNWLEPLIRYLDSNPDVGAVQPKILSVRDRTKFEYAGGAGGFIDWLGYPFCRGRVLDTIEEDSGQYNDNSDIFWASGAAFVVRSDLFKSLGGFDQSYFAHMEEIDLCWRIQRAGYRICYVPESTVYHLGGATLTYNSPKKVYLNFRNNIKTLLKNGDTPSLLAIIPLRLVLDVLAAIHFLVKGQFECAVAVAHAYASVIWSLPQQFKTAKTQRRSITSNRRGAALIRGVIRKSMLIQYYFQGRKKFSLLKGIPDGKK